MYWRNWYMCMTSPNSFFIPHPSHWFLLLSSLSPILICKSSVSIFFFQFFFHHIPPLTYHFLYFLFLVPFEEKKKSLFAYQSSCSCLPTWLFSLQIHFLTSLNVNRRKIFQILKFCLPFD